MKSRGSHPGIRSPSPHVSAAVNVDNWVSVGGQGPLDMGIRKGIPDPMARIPNPSGKSSPHDVIAS